MRAAASPQALRLTMGRRLATTRAPATISEAITRDHRDLRRYYDEIVNNKGDLDHQDRYGNQFRWQLARHSVAEELIVYPAFEKYLGDTGKVQADRDREQHHKLKVLLKEFQKLNAADDAFVPKLEEIWTELKHHIEDEESKDLPDLEKALSSRPIRGSSDGDSEALAKKFERTKAFVPSRSHPSVGENPWFESAVGMLAAPIDRIADLFRKFPDDITDMQAPSDRGAKDRGIDGRADPDASRQYTTARDGKEALVGTDPGVDGPSYTARDRKEAVDGTDSGVDGRPYTARDRKEAVDGKDHGDDGRPYTARDRKEDLERQDPRAKDRPHTARDRKEALDGKDPGIDRRHA